MNRCPSCGSDKLCDEYAGSRYVRAYCQKCHRTWREREQQPVPQPYERTEEALA